MRIAILVSLIFLTLDPIGARARTGTGNVTEGVVVRSSVDSLRVSICGASVVHIVGNSRETKPPTQTPWITQPCEPGESSIEEGEKEMVINTKEIIIRISRGTGSFSIFDKTGSTLLQEFRRRYEGRNGTNSASESFHPAEEEAFYGLGQHQNGLFNYRGATVLLAQQNTDIAIPFFLSTKGYGILWNTAARSIFDNRDPTNLKLSADGVTGIDYYFFYGPEANQILHSYRVFTGHVPLYPLWAYGLFQSKDRYRSQAELLEIARKYRSLNIPADAIVQDYYWWTKQGASEFNQNYPDPGGMIQQLHDIHFHTMISVWPSFDDGTDALSEMRERNMLVAETSLYDATNPAARELYWTLLPSTLLKRGFDGLWLDATEPEDDNGDSDALLQDKTLFAGDGAFFTNAYPLFHSESIYRHWREEFPSKRVFQLTRSAFLGEQRTGAASWSGDVQSNFWALSRQIPAGLNFMLSGLPYWTTDIGGYGYPAWKDTRDPSYQELFTRWFEYGTFCPLFRIHGHRTNNENEIWSYGSQTPTLILYDRLRYRLLPYIYSDAWRVTSEDSTLMRPLVMDFRADKQVWNIGDAFLFGPAILVSPVAQAGVKARSVYLPGTSDWFDFWTGERVSGGQQITAAAPVERIPLFVRSGSIIPLGPEIEFSGEASDPLELRVYGGSDASFDLYEDEGDNYNYEHGAYSLIPIRCNESRKTLTIGKRSGQFPGMALHRTFRVVWVGSGHGIGEEPTEKADQVIEYQGESITVREP